MVKAFIRGGQTFAHNCRMLWQTTKISIFAGIFTVFVVIIFWVLLYLEPIHYEYMWGYVKAVAYDISYFYREDAIYAPSKIFKTNLRFLPKDFLNPSKVSPVYIVFEEIKRIILGGVFRGIGGGIAVVIISAILMTITGRAMRKSKHVRGAKLIDSKELKSETRQGLFKRFTGIKPICIGEDRISYPSDTENLHTLIMGGTGVGKTVTTIDIFNQIKERGESAIILDLKGTYIEKFYEKDKDIILNPLDSRCPEWNLMNEVENYAHIKSLAESFIPYGGDKSEIWNKAAREGFTGILEDQLSRGKKLSNNEIVEMFLKSSVKEISKLAKDTYASSIIDITSPETAASVVFNLCTHITSLRLITAARDQGFSIRKWYKEREEGSCIYISGHSEYESLLRPLQTAWWEVALRGLVSEKRKKKTWIILDEIGALYRIPSFANSVALAREYNGCIIACMQDMSQIRRIYGREDAKTISSNFGTRCFFKANDADTAEWISKDLGYGEIEESSEALSYGAHTMRDGVNLSSHKKTVPIVRTSQVQYLEKYEMYLKMFGKYPAKIKVKPINKPDLHRGFIEDSKLNEKLSGIRQDVKKIFDGKMGIEIKVKEDMKKIKNNNNGNNMEQKTKETKKQGNNPTNDKAITVDTNSKSDTKVENTAKDEEMKSKYEEYAKKEGISVPWASEDVKATNNENTNDDKVEKKEVDSAEKEKKVKTKKFFN